MTIFDAVPILSPQGYKISPSPGRDLITKTQIMSYIVCLTWIIPMVSVGAAENSGSFPNVLLSFEAGVIGVGDDGSLLAMLVSPESVTHDGL